MTSREEFQLQSIVRNNVLRAILYTLKWHRRDLPETEQILEAERMYAAFQVNEAGPQKASSHTNN